jgi:hypothetical protein
MQNVSQKKNLQIERHTRLITVAWHSHKHASIILDCATQHYDTHAASLRTNFSEEHTASVFMVEEKVKEVCFYEKFV